MSAFKFTGDCDEVSAKLKAALDADDARFNANLAAIFKPPSPSNTPTPRAGGSQDSTGWTRDARASRRDDDVRGRMRKSLRVKPPR